jgi:hopanoid C-2 methylase
VLLPPGAGSRRKILCVFPAYSPSFGTFENAYRLRGKTRAFMPPQGLLAIAAYLPKAWEVRFIDENIRRAGAQDLAWADAVLVSGMHVQRRQILDINRRARCWAAPRSRRCRMPITPSTISISASSAMRPTG